MARVLVVGSGCRGAALAGRLSASGHAVRGTTRRPDRVDELESLGVEAALADPGRLATVTPLLEGVSAMCWLMASATGSPGEVAALHGDRLRSMLDVLVDTHVRGFIYERAGTVDPESLTKGERIARRAEEDDRIRVAMIDAPPDDQARWLDAASRAVDDVLSA